MKKQKESDNLVKNIICCSGFGVFGVHNRSIEKVATRCFASVFFFRTHVPGPYSFVYFLGVPVSLCVHAYSFKGPFTKFTKLPTKRLTTIGVDTLNSTVAANVSCLTFCQDRMLLDPNDNVCDLSGSHLDCNKN